MNEHCIEGKIILPDNVSDSCEPSMFASEEEPIPQKKISTNDKILEIMSANSNNISSLVSSILEKNGDSSLIKEVFKLKKNMRSLKKNSKRQLSLLEELIRKKNDDA